VRAAGDVDNAFASCPHVVRGGTQRLPSQTHMYMEPQTAIAVRAGPLLCEDSALWRMASACQPHAAPGHVREQDDAP